MTKSQIVQTQKGFENYTQVYLQEGKGSLEGYSLPDQRAPRDSSSPVVPPPYHLRLRSPSTGHSSPTLFADSRVVSQQRVLDPGFAPTFSVYVNQRDRRPCIILVGSSPWKFLFPCVLRGSRQPTVGPGPTPPSRPPRDWTPRNSHTSSYTDFAGSTTR